eukprot:scpid98820/ scgid11834/ 
MSMHIIVMMLFKLAEATNNTNLQYEVPEDNTRSQLKRRPDVESHAPLLEVTTTENARKRGRPRKPSKLTPEATPMGTVTQRSKGITHNIGGENNGCVQVRKAYVGNQASLVSQC